MKTNYFLTGSWKTEGALGSIKKPKNRSKNYPKPKNRDRFRSKPKSKYKTIKTEDLYS